MPGGWSKRYEFDKLVDTHSDLEFDIPVAELPDLPEGVGAAVTPLHAKLQFAREQGWPLVRLQLRGEVGLICQRCLRAMRLPVAADSRVLLLASEAEAERVPPEEETFLAEGGWLSAAQLVTEELLLSLPAVPRHENVSDCSAERPEPAGEPAETQRPFADLRAMMKRE